MSFEQEFVLVSLAGISYCFGAAWIRSKFGTRALWAFATGVLTLTASLNTWRIAADPYAEVPWQTSIVSIVIPGFLAAVAVHVAGRRAKPSSVLLRGGIGLIALIFSYLVVAVATYMVWGSQL